MDGVVNTANAISVLFELAKDANLYLEENQTEKLVIEAFQTAIKDLLGILGIQLEEEALLDQEIDQLILEREEARKEKDFTKADEIRDLLKSKDIILEDRSEEHTSEFKLRFDIVCRLLIEKQKKPTQIRKKQK